MLDTLTSGEKTVPQDTLTFQTFDKLKRQDLADRCTHIVTRFYPLYEGSFVLALNGAFGSGKTTFLKMWKHQLEEAEHKVVYIDAWGTDFSDDPLIAIIGALLDGLGGKSFIEKLKPAFLGALGAAAYTAGGLAAHLTGLNPYGAVQAAGEAAKNATLQKAGEDLYREFSFKKQAYQTLKDKLSDYVAEIKAPLIIFVDELDRVRPDYAVKFLEAIKHIFSLQGVCFVLAVDRQQMESSVRQLYGNIDFENYYRRFITREVQLPQADTLDLSAFIANEVTKLCEILKKVGARPLPREVYENDLTSSIKKACKFFKLSLREAESLMRILSHLSISGFSFFFQYTGMFVYLIAISIHNRNIYARIGQGMISPTEINIYLRKIDPKYEKVRGHSPEKPENELIFSIMASTFPENPGQELLEKVKEFRQKYQYHPCGAGRSDQDVIKEYLEGFENLAYIYMRHGTVARMLYNHIETWRPFV